MAKKPGNDSPFGVLKELRGQLADEEKALAEKLKIQRIERQRQAATADEERDLLEQAMAGVKRLGPDTPAPKRKPLSVPVVSPKTDELGDASLAVDEGRPPLNFTETDELVEGRAQDCSRLDLMKLKAGDFAIQAQLDLHRKDREEAREALFGFFAQSMSMSYRCVNIICGRGLHTPGGKPVLKELLVGWLVRGSLSYNVLAFATAEAKNGGVGAITVLLRRPSRKGLNDA